MYDDVIIHWNFNSKKNKTRFKNYVSVLDNFNKKLTDTKMQKLFKKKVKQVYEVDSKGAMKILKFASVLNGKMFQRKVEDLINLTSFGVAPQEVLKKDVKNMTEAEIRFEMDKINELNVNNLMQSFQGVVNFFTNNSSTNLTEFFNYVSKIENYNEFKNNGIVEINNKKVQMIQDIDMLKRISNEALGQLKGIGSRYMNAVGNGNVNDQLLKEYKVLKGLIDRLAGFCYEAVIANGDSFITTKVKNVLGKGAWVEKSATESGTGDLEYHTGTTDFKLHADGTGALKIDVPIGISLKKKATGLKQNSSTRISFKKSTLKKMLDISMTQLNIPNKKEFEALTNILYTYNNGRKKPGQRKDSENKFNYEGKNVLRYRLNSLLAITGMAGAMTAKDISTVIVVDNKVLNIYDLIGQIFKVGDYGSATIGGGITVDKIRNIQSSNEWEGGRKLSYEDEKVRSKRAIAGFSKVAMNMWLTLNAQLIQKLSKL